MSAPQSQPDLEFGAISLRGVTKRFGDVTAVDALDLDIAAGEMFSLLGGSGSGKTTLLNLIGCVDIPSDGAVRIAGHNTSALNDAALTNLRLRKLGFIFQSFNLIPVLDVFQNVEFPLLLQGELTKEERAQRVKEILRRVGLTDQIHQRPNELSGGQRQRVAIARALVTRPTLLVADEPTGNLDTATTEEVIELMKSLNASGLTVVMVTHEPEVAQHAKRVVYFVDGRIAADGTPEEVLS